VVRQSINGGAAAIKIGNVTEKQHISVGIELSDQ
jgi:hypothetical protein